MKKFLTKIVDYNDSIESKVFNTFIQIIVVLSIINFSISTIPDLSESTKKFIENLNLFFTIIFTIEYLLRIYIAEKKFDYIFSFYGIVDLLSILPFYLQSGVDSQFIKLLRLFKLIRILKLFRYYKTIEYFKLALKESKEEFIVFLSITLFLFYLSAVGIYFFEHQAQPEHFSSVFASMWWAVATLTTVGYGDVYPVTVGGKIFTTIILILGLGIVSVPAGIISSALLNIKNKDENKKEEMLKNKINQLEKELEKYKN